MITKEIEGKNINSHSVLADVSSSFLSVAKSLIEELKEYKEEYTPKRFAKILELEQLAKKDKKKFVKQYKKLSGATDWDLPDVIYAEG